MNLFGRWPAPIRAVPIPIPSPKGVANPLGVLTYMGIDLKLLPPSDY